MKKRYGCAAVLGIGLALAPWAAAQVPAEQPAAAPAAAAVIPPDQQPTKEQLAKLFDVMRIRQQLQNTMQMMPSIMQQQMQAEFKQLAAKGPGGSALKPAQQEALEKILNRYMVKAMNVFTADEMIDDMTALYQRHFSRADVDALIAFFSSPAGQHLLDEGPVIMREYMPVVMKRAQERILPLSDGLQADIAAYMKSQVPAEATPKPKASPRSTTIPKPQ
ncbi:MAG: DUF2059 domain-containing protein [Terracidiphilus sp.]